MHQINAPKFLLLSLKSSIAEKKHVAMQKLFIKKRKMRKNGQVSKIFKTMGTWMPVQKKRGEKMNKIVHVFL